ADVELAVCPVPAVDPSDRHRMACADVQRGAGEATERNPSREQRASAHDPSTDTGRTALRLVAAGAEVNAGGGGTFRARGAAVRPRCEISVFRLVVRRGDGGLELEFRHSERDHVPVAEE